MHDNARPHVAEVCQQFLHDEGIDAMDWPASSPDLTRSIHQRHVAPQTVQELTDALIQVWEKIPQENIRRLFRSMPRRCREVLQPHFDLSWGISTEVGSACNVIFHFYLEYDSRSRPPWDNNLDSLWSFLCYFVLNAFHYVMNNNFQLEYLINWDLGSVILVFPLFFWAVYITVGVQTQECQICCVTTLL